MASRLRAFVASIYLTTIAVIIWAFLARFTTSVATGKTQAPSTKTLRDILNPHSGSDVNLVKGAQR